MTAVRVPDEFVVGVDVGQIHDPTAIVILQRAGEWGEKIVLRHTERIPLAVSYPAQVDHLAQIVTRGRLNRRSRMAVDATGVGTPVVQMIKRGVDCPCTPIVITSGIRASTGDNGWLRVPKRDLIAGAQVAIEQQQLVMPRTVPDVATLVKELAAYRVKISTDGHDTYENDAREQDHDDLVLALACGLYAAARRGWGKPIVPVDPHPPVNADHVALHADPAGLLETWADTDIRPARAGTVGVDPLAGWWNQ